MPRVSFPSMKYSRGWSFGVAKPTSISPLRIHSTAQYRPLRGEATVGVYELV